MLSFGYLRANISYFLYLIDTEMFSGPDKCVFISYNWNNFEKIVSRFGEVGEVL